MRGAFQNMETKGAFAVFAAGLAISAFLLSGCMDESWVSDKQPLPPDGRFGPDGRQFPSDGQNGTRSNMTDAQRQEMQQQRIQAAIDACRGKAENETCTFAGGRGSFNATATCITRQGNLECTPSRQGGQPPFGRDGNRTGRGFEPRGQGGNWSGQPWQDGIPPQPPQ